VCGDLARLVLGGQVFWERHAVGVRLLTLGAPAMVRHDGIVSVAAGFKRHEVLDLARRVGLPHVQYRRHLFGRFTLVSTK